MACIVTRHVCPQDTNAIGILANSAAAQQVRNSGFNYRIQPWEARCDSAYWHYIARSPAGIICGWLRASLVEEKGMKYIYLAEISTRRIKDEFYGGVGQRLHAALVADARAQGADFIYLYPLNDTVAAIYSKWGYVQMRPEIVNMFFILESPPSHTILDTLMPESARKLLVAAHEIAKRKPEDAALLSLIQKTRRNLLSQLKFIRELAGAIEEITGVEILEEIEAIPPGERMTLGEKRDRLREIFSSVKGGKRKTRRKRRSLLFSIT